MARIGIWNVEWKRPGSDAGEIIADKLRSLSADVLCINEGFVGNLPADGYTITSHEDYGYPIKAGKRKVLLWSRQPWSHVDMLGHKGLPGGRFVAGTTTLAFGEVRVIGVAISWRDAHVYTGRRDRKPWQDHIAYSTALKEVLTQYATATIVVGDYNARIPRFNTPQIIYDTMMAALEEYTIATSGVIPGLGEAVIDHLAHTSDLRIVEVAGWSRIIDGKRVSDHHGVSIEIDKMVKG